MIRRFLARQFARPSGPVGRWIIGPWLDSIGRPMSRLAFEQLAMQPGERGLEVGFGGGELSALLLEAGARVTGVDLSDAMVARAHRRFGNEVRAGRAAFVAGSAEALPLRPASFDKAATVNTVYFWPDPLRVARELARVLRPGGDLVICFQTATAVRRWPGHRHGFIAHDEPALASAIESAGFELVETRRGSAPRLGDYLCMKGRRR